MTTGIYKRTEETLEKMRIAHLKENLSDETLGKMRKAQLGKHLSEEIKLKISKTNSGKHYSPKTEFKKGLIPWHKGKTKVYSEETLRKMKIAKKGRLLTERHKRKIGESLKGRIFTEETISKMSESAKGRIITEDTKRKIMDTLKGRYCKENNPNWKGGLKLAWARSYERQKNNLQFRLNNRIHVGINQSLKGEKNGQKWESLVGYNLKQLKKRLEFTMPINYTWQDFMNCELEIDHIIPIDAFNFSKPEDLQFKRCWALSNLRLLPKNENRKKSNKIIKPFQICFEI